MSEKFLKNEDLEGSMNFGTIIMHAWVSGLSEWGWVAWKKYEVLWALGEVRIEIVI